MDHAVKVAMVPVPEGGPADAELRARGPLPRRATAQAAGLDLLAWIADPLTLEAGARARIACGFRMALPAGHEGQVRPRSGLAAKHGVTVLNAPGTIDADYRGEVMVILVNHGDEAFVVDPGCRVAQLVVAPVTRPEVEQVAELPASDRGEGGFGSTGF